MSEDDTGSCIIDLDEADSSILEEVKKYMGDKIYQCLQCGTCTSGCPMTPFGYNIRRIVKLVLLGLKKELIQSDFIWFCSECGKCGERCPHGIKSPNLISILRKITIESGYLPASYKQMVKKIQTSGKITEINEAINLKRERCGLESLKDKINKEALDEINIIIKETDLLDKIKKKKDE